MNMAMNGDDVVSTKSAKESGRFIPKGAAVSYLTDALTGVLQGEHDLAQAWAERVEQKLAAYGLNNDL